MSIKIGNISASSVQTPSNGRITLFADSSNSDHLTMIDDQGTLIDLTTQGDPADGNIYENDGAIPAATFRAVTIPDDGGLTFGSPSIPNNLFINGVTGISKFRGASATNSISIDANSREVLFVDDLLGGRTGTLTDVISADQTWTLPDLTGTILLDTTPNVFDSFYTTDGSLQGDNRIVTLGTNTPIGGGTLEFRTSYGGIGPGITKNTFAIISNETFPYIETQSKFLVTNGTIETPLYDEYNESGSGYIYMQVGAAIEPIRALKLELDGATGAHLINYNLLSGFSTDVGYINPTANNAILFPDAGGTVALTSDLGSGSFYDINGIFDGLEQRVATMQGGTVKFKQSSPGEVPVLREVLNIDCTNTNSPYVNTNTYYRADNSINGVLATKRAQLDYSGVYIDDLGINNNAFNVATNAGTGLGFLQSYATGYVNSTTVKFDNPTAVNTIAIPDASGTIALTSDLGSGSFYDNDGTMSGLRTAIMNGTIVFKQNDNNIISSTHQVLKLDVSNLNDMFVSTNRYFRADNGINDGPITKYADFSETDIYMYDDGPLDNRFFLGKDFVTGLGYIGTTATGNVNSTTVNFDNPTAVNTIAIPDASGTISLLDIYTADGTLTSNRLINTSTNTLSFQNSNDRIEIDPTNNAIKFLNPGIGTKTGTLTSGGALVADYTWTLPQATGDIALTSDIVPTLVDDVTIIYNSAGELEVIPTGVTSVIAGDGIAVDTATGDVTVSVANPIKIIQVPLITSQLLNLNATPVELIAGQVGIGYMVENMIVDHQFGTLAFVNPTGTGGSNMGIRTVGSTNGAAIQSDVLLEPGSKVEMGASYVSPAILELISGAGVEMYKPSSEYTTGDGNAVITIYYREFVM